MPFNPQIEKVIQHYHDRMSTEEEKWASIPEHELESREDEFLLAVGRVSADFMNTLIKSAGSKIILELGTSYGYSTLFLAEAARATGGKVITMELQGYKINYAKNKLKEAGLDTYVEFREGDALSSLKKATERFDFVLLDIWKRFYLPCFELFYPKLSKGAWVIADNMLHPPQFLPEATAYRKRIRETGGFDSVQLPIGSGLETSYFR